MTPAQEKHLSRYPHARPSTLARIGAKEKTTAQLRVDLALEDWERTFTAETLRQIEAESREQAERIRESW